MDIRPVKKADYEAALKEIEALMNSEPGTPEGYRLDLLADLISAYEHEHFPMELPRSAEALEPGPGVQEQGVNTDD